MNLKQLRAQLKGIVAKMRTHLDADELDKFTAAEAQANEIKAQISRMVALEEFENLTPAPAQPVALVGAQGPNAPHTEPAPGTPLQNFGGIPSVPGESADAFRNRMIAAGQQDEIDRQAGDPTNRLSLANNGEGVNNGFSAGEERDLNEFRLTNFCAQAVSVQNGGKLEGLNNEINQMAFAEAKASGTELRGAGIPAAVLNYRPNVAHSIDLAKLRNKLSSTGSGGFNPTNDMVAGTTTAGGHLIATELRSPIDVLRERLRVVQLGATMLTGLTGNIDFPRWAVGTDPGEKAENAAADEYTPSLSKFTMSPHRLPIFTEVSNQLLIQSSTDVEAWLRFELGFRQATVIDQRALNGDGVGDRPLGLRNFSGVNSVAIATDGGPLTRDHLIDMETAIAEDNADLGVMGFLTTPGVRGHLKKEKVDAGSGEFVWPRGTDATSLEGYNALTSTNVPSNLTKGVGTDLHAMFFGVWSNLLLGQWGGVDIIVNPYSRDTEGLIRLTFTMFYDINFRYPEAFSIIEDIDIS